MGKAKKKKSLNTNSLFQKTYRFLLVHDFFKIFTLTVQFLILIINLLISSRWTATSIFVNVNRRRGHSLSDAQNSGWQFPKSRQIYRQNGAGARCPRRLLSHLSRSLCSSFFFFFSEWIYFSSHLSIGSSNHGCVYPHVNTGWEVQKRTLGTLLWDIYDLKIHRRVNGRIKHGLIRLS